MSLYNSYQKLIKADVLFERSPLHAQYTGELAAKHLKDKIEEGNPIMITRFGANELNCILNYHFINDSFANNVKNIISGIPYFLKFKKGIIKNLDEVAGFFPPTESNIIRFCQLSLQDLTEIDVLGSWLNHESYLYPMMKPDHTRVRLRDLTPLTNNLSPWTEVLKGKKVLVIHPFEETIKRQYKNRHLLFENHNMLPDFELKTLKSVQSVADNGSHTRFKDWFEALDYMKEAVENIDFDIAIIGCGAYGMPLAAHVKRIGKQAFHLGGETQIMFGIKGKRWEEPSYDYNNLFYNEHWVRPLDVDTPRNINKVEEGCYW